MFITKDGQTVHGLAIMSGDPSVVISAGGLEQLIPRKRVKSERKFKRSLMLSGEQLGLSAQDVADVVAFLKEYE